MQPKRDFSRLLENVPPSGIREFFDLVIGRKDVISLGVGEPDFATPWAIREAGFYALEKGRTSYTSNKGLKELRVAAAQYFRERFKVDYDAEEEVLITVGGSEAIDLGFRALLNPGDEVLLPEPNYVCYRPLVELTGATAVTLDTTATRFLPEVAELKKKLTPRTKAIVLAYPSNPTGMAPTRAQQQAWANFAIENDLWVLSDEIYAELVFDGVPFESMASLPGMQDRTLLVTGVSKAFAMTGWRVGIAAGPASLLGRMCKIHQYAMLCAPIMSQYAAVEALTQGERVVAPMRDSYRYRRNYFVAALRQMGLEVHQPEGALYVFPSVRAAGLSSRDFAMGLLKEHSVAVVPGTAFGASGEGYIRCCYATEFNNLKEAAARMAAFVKPRLK